MTIKVRRDVPDANSPAGIGNAIARGWRAPAVPPVPLALFPENSGTIVIGMKQQLVTKAAVNLRVARLQRERIAACFNRILDPPRILEHIGKVVENPRLIGVEGKNPAINILGLVEPAQALMLQGFIHRLLLFRVIHRVHLYQPITAIDK